MSITSMTSRDTVSITRQTTTQQGTGGRVTSYTTAARGSRPTSQRCRVQPLSAAERQQYGVRGSETVWKFLFHADPQIEMVDQVEFTDADGVARTVRVTEPSRNLDGQGRIYRALGQELTNRQS